MKIKTEVILSCAVLLGAWIVYPHAKKETNTSIANQRNTTSKSPSPQPTDLVRGGGGESPQPKQTPTLSPQPTLPTNTAQSLSEPSSLWVIVNKRHPLPLDYVPSGLRAPAVKLKNASDNTEMMLREDAAVAAEKFLKDAESAGYPFMLVSAYRSSQLQKILYGRYVSESGQKEADTFSARPGYSEHQTGLGMDVSPPDNTCAFNACLGDTPGGKWLEDNAYNYGFVLRYPKNKQSITGYIYEPWHYRYVGLELSKELHEQGQILEEYFVLDPATTYP
jgi:zinc D-Ala-D-Ala carboxypeptidase